ncbi:hypothetical protein OPV22_028809 [Ensete ventricosum]|uniref:Uncharacterized protein n=1 Tax=Ensete ventricosum TaxID=4639 RepID=A0AAV8P6P9_ENSVE|nr:hypothetical protein OPV22_028809 [Ensete ventricosum]
MGSRTTRRRPSTFRSSFAAGRSTRTSCGTTRRSGFLSFLLCRSACMLSNKDLLWDNLPRVVTRIDYSREVSRRPSWGSSSIGFCHLIRRGQQLRLLFFIVAAERGFVLEGRPLGDRWRGG